MDCLVHQNKLPGRYVIYSFQEVRNTDRAGVEHRGHHYHVGMNEEMKEAVACCYVNMCKVMGMRKQTL